MTAGEKILLFGILLTLTLLYGWLFLTFAHPFAVQY